MNSRKSPLVFIFMLVCILAKINIGFGQVTECFDIEINSSSVLGIKSQQNVAENDTFTFINSCNNKLLVGSVAENDQIKSSDSLKICYIFAPKEGTLTFGSNGKFTFSVDLNFEGNISFHYRICHINNLDYYSEAEVLIQVKKDNDCDEITNEVDIDNDNDGIPDIHEGDGMIDTDNDEIPDNFDIDSDNDGITDIIEWQREGFYYSPLGKDANSDGWDDAFDPKLGGKYYELTDSDLDKIPDVNDLDSDNDGISDYIEAYDLNNSGIASVEPLYSDSDFDGLDDAFDIVSCWADGNNSNGCDSPLLDFNNDGIRDWRENNMERVTLNIYDEELLFLYPNPTKNNFSVYIPVSIEKPEIELSIYTISGKLVLNTIITKTNNKVEMPNNKSGVFIVKYKTDHSIQTEKLIISN